MLLATAAMVLSSRLDVDTGEHGFVGRVTSVERLVVGAASYEELKAWATVLVVGMTVAEGFSLCNEAYQLLRMGWTSYINLWNLIDSSASVTLLLGALAHFDVLGGGVHSFGAVGVGLKWLGFVDFLRCSDKTGSLVRMVVVIVNDIKPFFALLVLTLFATSSFLMVHEPESEAFGFDTTARGPLWPLVTIFLALLGSFEVAEYHGASVIVLLVFLPRMLIRGVRE